MLTFSIRAGAEPELRRAKSCSTTAPDRTSPNSNRASEKTAFGPLEIMPGGVEPCLTAAECCPPTGTTACCESQETKSGDKARKMILLVARKGHQRAPDEFSPELRIVSAPAIVAMLTVFTLLVQIEAKLQKLVTVVVVVPEEVDKITLKERDGLQGVRVYQ